MVCVNQHRPPETACMRPARVRLILLPRGVPGSLLSEAYQFQMQVASVKQSNVCHGRGEACYCILVQGHECLYNLQHKDYDNNLVTDNSWKGIAGELHAQDKELPRTTQHCRRMAG
jgi:hypothetical protein